MSKNNEDKLVPKLRFPEFINKGEWDLMQIGSILNAESSSLALNKLELRKSGYAVYGADSIIGYIDNFQHKDRYISIVKDGSGVGRLNLCDGETSTLGTLSTLKSKDEKKYKLVWAFYLLNTIDLSSYVKGSGIPHIYFSDYKNENIGVPKPEEQQKIAACLSSLDEVITSESQKLEALKLHKKGLLQNLFPQGGETVPKLRFKEFEDSGEWKEKKLEGLAKRGSGHTPNKQISNYYNGGIKWVSLADSNKLDNRYLYATKIQISKEGIENSSAVLHPAGTVILSRDAGVGKSAVLYSEMAVSQHFIVWVCDESKLSNWFLYYVFQILKPVFESIAVGSTIKTIGLPYFKELLIPVPSINEQQKIASCLSSVDDLINAQSEKVKALKLHKKGLLQDLFPDVNEVNE
jgi:type I restriction enzyme S subunit